MSLLLALTETPVPPPEENGGWAPYWAIQQSLRRKKRRDDDEQEAPEAPSVDDTVTKRVAQLQAAIVRAKNAQERARREADEAEADRNKLIPALLMAQAVEAQRQAELAYAAAVEAERAARHELRILDIAFVAAVLADM